MNYKKRIKKTLLSLIALTGLCTSLGNASHAQANTYLLTDEHGGTGNVKLYHKAYNYNWWVYTENSFGFLKINGEVVFCVDPPTNAIPGTYYSSEEIREGALVDHFGTKITQQQIDEIKNTIFWGWDMSEDKSYDRYFYVQTKVWDILGWTPQEFRAGTSWDSYNAVSDFVNGKLNGERATSWNGETHTVKVGESITLTDNNQVLPYINTPTNSKGWVFERLSDTQLKITATKDSQDGAFYFRNKSLPEGYTPASLLFTYPTSQNLMMFRDPDRLSAKLNLNVIKNGHIKIVKSDEKNGKVLAGVEFGLFAKGNDTPIKTAVTNKNGEAFFNDVEAKEWIVKETKTIQTHRLNRQTFKVNVVPNETATVKVTNAPKEGNIKIVKTDDETKKVLSGVEFGLYEKGSNKPVATATTNEKGEAYFNNYFPKEWDIKETRTLETYRLNEQVYSVQIKDGQTTTVNATNVSKKYKVSVSKHLDQGLDGSGTRQAGKGIQFDLVDSSNKVITSFITDENGYGVSQEISYNTPTWLVEHAPTGYKATEPIQVALDSSKDNHTYHYVVENNAKKSYLQLIKTDIETGKNIPASGVRFKLYKNGKQVSQQVTYPAIQTIDVFETDKNGQVTFPQQLTYGDYEIEEVQAPTGYVLSDKRLAVNISGNETVVTVKFANTPQKGQLQITKTGSKIVSWVKDGNGVNVPNIQSLPLAGVTFELIKDGKVVEQKTTNDKGIVEFTNKPLGKYQYREVSAPKEYFVDNTVREITFTPQAQTVKVDSHSVSVHNERKTISVQFNKQFEKSKYFKNEQKATFGLYTAKTAEGLPADSLVGVTKVSGTGSYTFDNLPIDGEFYLKELTTGEAYSLNDTRIGVSTSFATSGKSAQTVVVEKPIVNELKRGSHELVKVEANSKERIEGVEFKLVAVLENNSEIEVGHYSTDKNGRIVFKNLEYGNYYAEETKPAEGFLATIKKFFFTIKGGEKLDKNNHSTEATATRTVVENERKPLIHTEATTQSGGKKGYTFEKHIERADLTNLTIGKKYTIVATQYDSNGKVYATQKREFVADKAIRTEFFEFTVPVGYTGNIVYGEDLYRDKEKVATHFDLKNEKQTVEVLKPTINTFAKIGGKKVMTVGEKQELVDTLTYKDFKDGKVLVRTWLVKYGTNEVVGEPVEQILELDGSGEVKVKLDKIDTSKLPVGKYTIMEQVFEVNKNGEKGNLISEHVDSKDENQSFEVKPMLPKTGTQESGITILAGSIALIGALVLLKKKQQN